MTGKKALVVAAITTALGILFASSASASDRDDYRSRERGYVVPCSLDGVNPAYHPDIFGSPAVAASYGFVQSRDGIWHVQCSGVGAPRLPITMQAQPKRRPATTVRPRSSPPAEL